MKYIKNTVRLMLLFLSFCSSISDLYSSVPQPVCFFQYFPGLFIRFLCLSFILSILSCVLHPVYPSSSRTLSLLHSLLHTYHSSLYPFFPFCQHTCSIRFFSSASVCSVGSMRVYSPIVLGR